MYNGMPQPGIECNMLPPSVCIQNTREILKWQDFKTKQLVLNKNAQGHKYASACNIIVIIVPLSFCSGSIAAFIHCLGVLLPSYIFKVHCCSHTLSGFYLNQFCISAYDCLLHLIVFCYCLSCTCCMSCPNLH